MIEMRYSCTLNICGLLLISFKLSTIWYSVLTALLSCAMRVLDSDEPRLEDAARVVVSCNISAKLRSTRRLNSA